MSLTRKAASPEAEDRQARIMSKGCKGTGRGVGRGHEALHNRKSSFVDRKSRRGHCGPMQSPLDDRQKTICLPDIMLNEKLGEPGTSDDAVAALAKVLAVTQN